MNIVAVIQDEVILALPAMLERSSIMISVLGLFPVKKTAGRLVRVASIGYLLVVALSVWLYAGFQANAEAASTNRISRLESGVKDQTAQSEWEAAADRFRVAYRKGRIEDAFLEAEKAGELAEKAFTRTHPDYASSLTILASAHEAVGDYPKSESLYQEACALLRANKGEVSEEYAAVLVATARLKLARGRSLEAESAARQAVRITQAIQGGTNALAAIALNNLAAAVQAGGRFAEAEKLYREVQRIAASSEDIEDADSALILNNLGALHREMGEFERALDYSLQALRKWTNASELNLPNVNVAKALNNAGLIYQALGQYTNAESYLKRSLSTYEACLGSEHPESLLALNNLGLLYRDKGDFERSLLTVRRAAEVSTKALGTNHPTTATAWLNLGLVYQALAKYSAAESLYQQALSAFERVQGADHPNAINAANNLGMLYREIGDYVKAQQFIKRTVESCEKNLGPEHPRTAMALNNLAVLYRDMEDDVQALPLLERVLRIQEKSSGPEHPTTAIALMNLAGAMEDTNGERSLAMCERAVRINEAVLGTNHPDTASALLRLAGEYRARRQFPEARRLCQRALAIQETNWGTNHPAVADTLIGLGDLYDSMNQPEQAESLYQRALAIQSRALGSNHPITAGTLESLGDLYSSQGKCQEAEPLLRQSLQIRQNLLEQTAAVQSERQQLAMAWQEKSVFDSWLTAAVASGISSEAMEQKLLEHKGRVAIRQAALLRMKAAFERTVDRASLDLFEERENIIRQLGAETTRSLNVNSQNGGSASRMGALLEAKEEIERQLAAKSAGLLDEDTALSGSVESLRKSLENSPGTAFVDIVQYRKTPLVGDPQDDNGHYLAFVILGGKSGVRLIELGAPAAVIDATVRVWRETIDANAREWGGGSALRKYVWDKIEPALAGARTILISADGSLSQLPWNALPGRASGSFLIEEYSFALVPIPQLLPALKPSTSVVSTNLLVIGDVNYGSPIASENLASRSRASVLRDTGSTVWARLPGTTQEASDVMAAFAKSHPDQWARVLTNTEPSEARFRELAPTARFIHLATHGYFVDEKTPSRATALPSEAMTPERSTSFRVDEWSPGLMNGLVFAGANSPAELQADDGVLTAAEVQALDLRSVELAVLSACETGLGKEVSGEGVLGLQRAFQIAGVQSTIASLWKVPDLETHQLMREFYRRLWSEKKPKLQALREAQLWMLHQQGNSASREPSRRGLKPETNPDEPLAKPSPRIWAAFVLSGEWR